MPLSLAQVRFPDGSSSAGVGKRKGAKGEKGMTYSLLLEVRAFPNMAFRFQGSHGKGGAMSDGKGSFGGEGR